MGSFRLRIALITAAVVAVVLLAFGSTAWILIYRNLEESIDLRLGFPAGRLASELRPDTDWDRFERSVQIVVDPDNPATPLNVVVVMDHSDSNITYSSPSDAPWLSELDFKSYLPAKSELTEAERPNRLPPRARPPRALPGDDRRGPPPEKRPPPRKHRKPIFFSAKANGESWRFGAFSGPDRTLFAGVNMRQFDADVRRMRVYFLIAMAVGLALTAAAAWLVSRKAIRPIERITKTAQSITASGLDQRIPTTGREAAEFKGLVDVLNGMMERLEESFHKSARFTAEASHELKTPLAIMQGELEHAIQDSEPGTTHAQTLLNLGEETQRLKAITDKLLILSRADSGRIEAHRKRISLSEEVEAIAEDAEILCQQEGLKFSSQIEPDVFIEADRALARGVMHNLISNAIKYNEPNGIVLCKLYKDGDSAFVEIANTGSEIPADDREKIFDRFYRSDKARSRESDGFGLGLSIASELARANGGEVRLLEATDTITRFAAVFPLAERLRNLV